MSPALIILVTAIVLLITLWYLQLIKWNKYLWNYKGPRPLPIIGNSYDFRSTKDIIPNFMKYHYKYGAVFKLMFGHRPRLIICDPKLAEFLHGSSVILSKAYDYEYFHNWLGTGLLTSTGYDRSILYYQKEFSLNHRAQIEFHPHFIIFDQLPFLAVYHKRVRILNISIGTKWKRQRRLITPTFHFKILEQFVATFNSQTDILIQKLHREVDGKSFDIFPYIGLCALDVICEAAMGTSVNAQNLSESEYVLSVNEMCRIIMERSISPIKMWSFLYTFSRDYQKEIKALKVLHGYTNSVITKRRAALSNCNKTDSTKDDDMGIKKRLALLDLLLQCTIDGKPLSNESIREEVDTFMFEGHDTTTSGISFALYCLSKYPEVQEKAVKELKIMFADDKNRPTTYQDLQDMKYLEMVIKESMRLYPPVPMYGRILEEDFEYDGGILPKGLVLNVFPYGIHRQPDVFPDPETFDPERFTPENSSRRAPHGYVPFSAGPRNCIGQRFALMELKSVVSKVLRNFELLPVVEHKPVLLAEAILKSENGLHIRLKKRKF